MLNLSELLKLAVHYHQQGDLGQAERLYRQILGMDPPDSMRCDSNHADAANNLGIILHMQGKIAEGIESFRLALRINPNHADAHNNLGSTFLSQGRFAEAEVCYRQSLASDPHHLRAQWNHAGLRLLLGDLEGGWPGFELRWVQHGNAPRNFPQPRWDGSPLDGKTILVYAEQGLGDSIQFVRYLPMVKSRGGIVLFECQTALTEVLAGVAGVDQIIGEGYPLPPFDVQISLLSLPLVFGTSLATIPVSVPYITSGLFGPSLTLPARRGTTTAVAVGSGLNVGIVWQGSMNQINDRRSLALAHFEALAKIGGVRLVSLQVGPGTERLAAAPFPIADLGSHFNPNSLSDLAAALINQDLVVTVDTACAHLAGALGVPVWVVLNLVPCWRWLLVRSDSPWYPTMRLFRQKKLGDWSEVFEQIASVLRHDYSIA